MITREEILKREREEVIDQLREEEIKRIVKILFNSLSSGTEYEILSASILDLSPETETPTREFRLRLARRTRVATPDDSLQKEDKIVQNP